MRKKPKNNLPTWKSDSNFCGGVFDLDGKQKRVEELNKVTSQPDFGTTAKRPKVFSKSKPPSKMS